MSRPVEKIVFSISENDSDSKKPQKKISSEFAKSFFYSCSALAFMIAMPVLTSLRASAQSLPVGGIVASGTAAISAASANAVVIKQSTDRAVIDWKSFNVGQGYKVQFQQNSSSSATLNRVVGSTTSSIAGSVTANGQVYLVNPNGILITSTGYVNTQSFVASSLDIRNDDFMAGRKIFTGNGSSADVINNGKIKARRGGDIILLGGRVENNGTLSARSGRVGLAAGERVSVDMEGDGFLSVTVPTANKASTQALITQTGRIRANGGRVEMRAATSLDLVRVAVKISGSVEARSVGAIRGGGVVFGSGHSAARTRVTKTVYKYYRKPKPQPLPQPLQPGSVLVAGGAGGTVLVDGKISVAGNNRTAGGKIEITGRDIVLNNAKVDASGGVGGGSIKVGGDFRGGNGLMTASTVSIDSLSRISADARFLGDGGTVAVWSNDLTKFDGNISARGGLSGGDGGFVEVSGKAHASINGFVDTRAPLGNVGTFLIDPGTIEIFNQAKLNGVTLNGPDTFSDNWISTQLGTSNLILDTNMATGANGTAGDIHLNSGTAITWSSGNSLSLVAARNITFESGASITGTGIQLNLRSDSGGTGTGTILFNGTGLQAGGTNAIVNLRYNPSVNPANSAVNTTSYASPTETFTQVSAPGGVVTTQMLVNTANDLQNMQNNLTGSYALGRNIDASGTSSWNSNAGFVPIGNSTAFTGKLDGLGNSISGLNISRATESNIGLFGSMGSGSEVKNLALVNANIVGGTNVGAVAGTAANASLSNIFVSGAVAGSATVGGLVGDGSGSAISTSLSVAAVSGASETGGLVGNFSSGTFVSSYWNTTTSGQVIAVGSGSSSGATGLATAALQTSTALSGFSPSFWSSSSGSYPRLINQEKFDTSVTLSGNEQVLTVRLDAASSVYGNTPAGFNYTIVDSTGHVLTALELANAVSGSASGSQATTSNALSSVGTGTVYGAKGTLAALTGYRLVYENSNLQINARAVTVSGSQVFDGTTTVSSSNLTITNLVNGDTVSLSGSGVMAFRNVGSNALQLTSGALTGLSLTGGSSTNYTVVGGSGAVSVTPRSVILSGTQIYDGSTNSVATNLNITNVATGDTQAGIGLAGAGIMASRNVGSNALTSTSGALTGLTLTDTNYTLTAGSGTVTVNPRALTLTATQVYDGTTNAYLPNLVVTNVATGDTQAGIGLAGTGIMASRNVGANALTSTSGALTGLTLTDTNYTLTAGSGTVTVNPRALTLTATQVYDGTTNAYLPNLNITNVATGDTQAGIGLAGTGIMASRNVGSNALTSTSGALTGLTLTDTNYTLTAGSGTVTVNPRALTLTATQVYDGTTNAYLPNLNITNVATGDTQAGIGLAGTGIMASRNVGSNALTSTPGGALTGLTLTDTNYTLTAGSGTVTVNPRALTLTATQVYDGTTNAYLPNLVVTNVATGDTQAGIGLAGTGIMASRNVGSNALTSTSGALTGLTLTDTNYTLTAGSGTVTVNPRALTLSATQVYDGTTNAYLPNLNITNVATGDTQAGIGLAGTGIMASRNVGSNALTSTSGALTGLTLTDTNYTLTAGSGTVTVNPRALTLTATQVYDGTTNAYLPNLNVTNVATGDTQAGIGLAGTGIMASRNVGANALTSTSGALTGLTLTDTNYTLTAGSGTVTVNPRALTLTATQVYDGTTNAYLPNLVVTNVATGDTQAGIGLAGTGIMASRNVGANALTSTSGALTGLTLTDTNYTLTAGSGTVTVNPRALTLTATQVYDGTTNAYLPNLVVTNVATGDTQAGIGLAGTGIMASRNVGSNALTSTSGALTGLTLTDTNYTLTAGSGTVTVNPRALTLTATQVYDGTTNAYLPNLVVTNVATGDTQAGIGLAGTGIMASRNVGSNALTSTSGALTGLTLTDTNYTLTAGSGTVTVNPRALTLTATQVYDGTTNAYLPNLVVTNVATGDTQAGIGLAGTGIMASRNVGANALTSTSGALTGLTLTDTNYTLTAGSGTVTVNPRALTLTATQVYDGTINAYLPNLVVTNVATGDTQAGIGLAGTGIMASRNVGSNALTSTSGALTGLTLTDTNYTLTAGSGTVTVNPRALTLSATQVYDGTTNAYLPNLVVTNVATGDTQAGIGLAGTGIMASRNVGANALTSTSGALTGLTLTDTNYTLTAGSGTVTVNPRALTLTATQVYDGTTNAYLPNLNITNVATGDTQAGIGLAGTGIMASRNVGANALTSTSGALTGLTLTDTNYTLTAGSGTVTVNPRALTLTATQVYDGTTNAYLPNLVVTNVATGDTQAGIGLSGKGTITDKDVGLRPLVLSDNKLVGLVVTNTNYTIKAASGVVTIDPRPITLVAIDNSKFETLPDPILAYRIALGAMVKGEAISGNVERGEGEDVGDYDIDIGDVFAGSNYAITYVPGTFKILALPGSVKDSSRVTSEAGEDTSTKLNGESGGGAGADIDYSQRAEGADGGVAKENTVIPFFVNRDDHEDVSSIYNSPQCYLTSNNTISCQ